MSAISDGWSSKSGTLLTYDNLDRLTTLTHQTGTGTNLASYGYAFDAAGRLTRETNAEGTATFTYDNTDQLTGADRPPDGARDTTWLRQPGPDDQRLHRGRPDQRAQRHAHRCRSTAMMVVGPCRSGVHRDAHVHLDSGAGSRQTDARIKQHSQVQPPYPGCHLRPITPFMGRKKCGKRMHATDTQGGAWTQANPASR